MQPFYTQIKNFLRSAHGAITIEFVFVLPLLLLLFWGGVELTQYVRRTQKLEKTSSEIADVITQYTCNTSSCDASSSSTLTDTVLSQLSSSLNLLMAPSGSAATRVIITDVLNTATSSATTPAPKVQWQACFGGLTGYGSKLTSACGSTVTGCALNDNSFGGAGFQTGTSGFEQNMAWSPLDEEDVVVEVYYLYTPLTNAKLISTIPIYRAAMSAPRSGYGTITGYTPGNTYKCQ